MNRILLIWGMIICCLMCSCNNFCKDKDKVECKQLPSSVYQYIPYQWNGYQSPKQILFFENELGDKLQMSVTGVNSNYLENACGCYSYWCMGEIRTTFGEMLVNGIPITGDNWLKYSFKFTQDVYNKNESELKNGKYDICTVSFGDNNFLGEKVYSGIDFSIDSALGKKIEMVIDTTWLHNGPDWSRVVIGLDKGLIEFDDIMNNCTWKLIE